MTLWGRARCEECSVEVGPQHPIFTTERTLPWTSFVACGICGLILCRGCASGDGCPRCGDPWIVDGFPPIWLNVNRAVIWAENWCVVCKQHTRPQGSGYRPDPALAGDARWFACLNCAREYCERCALARRARCYCREKVAFRGVPPRSAYLSAEQRTSLEGLSRADQIELLERERRKLVSNYERGVLNGAEIERMTWALDGVLLDYGIDPGPTPWCGPSHDR